MPKCINLVGQKFGKLTVIKISGHDNHGKITWECHCECGNATVSTTGDLRSGSSRSCGCSRNGKIMPLTFARSINAVPEWLAWKNIIQRCTNPHHKAYENYGGRGIKICDEWKNDFLAFYNHIGKRPTPKHEVDRIDNEVGYVPENVRWATRKEQSNNRRSNRLITYKEKTMTISQWADEIGIDRKSIQNRIRAGWSVDKTLTEPLHK